MDDKDLENYIIENGIDAKIIYFNKPTATVESAVDQLNLPKDHIVKTILVINERNEPFVVLVNGDRKVSFNKVAQATNSKSIRMAKAEEVKEILGYEVGSVPPISFKTNLAVLVDKRLKGYEYLVGGGGTRHSLLRLKPDDIILFNSASTFDVSE